MGYPLQSYTLVLPKPVMLFFLFLAYVDFAVSLLLHRLRLVAASTPEPPIPRPWEEHALRPAPDTTPSSSIKKQLRVVEFSSVSNRWGVEEATCVICLGEVKEEDKVRELGNCGHGFHLECIDKWVDVGQVTCPVCRSHLLSPRRRWRRFLWPF